MSGKDKINKILEVINSGKTVYFTTYLKSYAVDAKTLRKFEKAGHKLFKGSKNSIYMLSGKSYICMDGCRITFA